MENNIEEFYIVNKLNFDLLIVRIKVYTQNTCVCIYIIICM